MTIKNKVAAVATSVAMLATTMTPAFASVSGSATNETTGAGSTNNSIVEVDQATTLVQENAADIQNKINIQLNTGKNNANKNTGSGDIYTGDVDWAVGVANTANTNHADLDVCGGCDFELFTGNDTTGADSKNDAQVEVKKINSIFQENKADVDNDVEVKANTGENNANKNTYSGYIETGDIDGATVLANDLNKNLAKLGGNGSGALLAAFNSTTGADSKNQSLIQSLFTNSVVQENEADVDNNADLMFNTGKNNANKNTGQGDVYTGDVMTDVAFATYANTNALDFDGCCDVEFLTDNTKTGADSKNESKAKLNNLMDLFQNNCGESKCKVDNDVEGKINTGENNTNKNNVDANSSGDIDGVVYVESETNKNVLGNVDWDISDSAAFWMLALMM